MTATARDFSPDTHFRSGNNWDHGEKTSLEQSKFYPRSVAIAKPPGQKMFEFLVVGNSELGGLARISNVFSRHGIFLNVFSSSMDERSNQAIGTFYVDFERADCSPQRVSDEIESLTCVSEVRFVDMKDKVYDQFLFPLETLSGFRVVVIRAEAFLQLEKKMVTQLGTAGASIMFEEGRTYGQAVMKQLKESFYDGADLDAFFKNVMDGLRAMGWGIPRFQRDGDAFDITIKDPPSLPDGSEEKEQIIEPRFFYGILAGFLEELYGVEFRLVSSKYNPEEISLFVHFEGQELKG